jgi:uncharacterized protein
VNRRDWTLLAICAAGGKGVSPVQLQKVLFLLGRELPHEVSPNFYTFAPYNYGPFSRAIYDDAECLADSGAVAITKVPGENWNRFIATGEGCVRAEEARRSAPKAAAEYLDRAVEWASRQSFQSLVRSIYDKYPDMKVNSVFNG